MLHVDISCVGRLEGGLFLPAHGKCSVTAYFVSLVKDRALWM